MKNVRMRVVLLRALFTPAGRLALWTVVVGFPHVLGRATGSLAGSPVPWLIGFGSVTVALLGAAIYRVDRSSGYAAVGPHRWVMRPGRLRAWARGHTPALRDAVSEFGVVLAHHPFDPRGSSAADRADLRQARSAYRHAQRARVDEVRILLAQGYLALNRLEGRHQDNL